MRQCFNKFKGLSLTAKWGPSNKGYKVTNLVNVQIRPAAGGGTFELQSVNGVVEWVPLTQPPPGQINFSDGEIPGGAMDGTNKVFTLAHPPVGRSLILAYNGVIQNVGTDYQQNMNNITMSEAPVVGDTLLAWYRY